jgi:hypothetical protein
MTGKASLLLILGFSVIFLVFGRNFASLSTRGVDNMINYYDETVAHDIAVSGANMAANEFFLNNNWNAGFPTTSYNGGTFKVTFSVIDAFNDVYKIKSEGNYNNITSDVEITLKPSSFSKFAYFSMSEGGNIYWTGNDTVWGPFHTQDHLRASYHPTFMGKASSFKSILYLHNEAADKPNFNGGYASGVDLPLPTDGVSKLEASAAAGGFVFSKTDYTKDKTVYLTFAGDSIKYKFSASGPETTVLGSTMAPNGVIFAPDATLRIKGTVKGKYSIGASGNMANQGSIILDGDIVYNSNPMTNPNSTDMLGIVAENDVVIANNSENNKSINIFASIYCENGGFNAEDYDSRPVSGNINLYGGIIHKTRGAVGTFDTKSGNILHGFAKKYKYDDRFLLASPPSFPGTGMFEIVSWYE